MNRIHRTVFNARTGTHVAVAETARAHGKSAGATGVLLAVVLLAGPALAQLAPTALPTAGQVAAGQAAIATSGSAMTITQSSQRAAINWQSFQIGAQASVQFNQPNAAAATLNRVTGAEASVIEGALRANGQVWLVNPNGVLFNGSARVDVGGLVASTRDLGVADFMAGRASFQGSGTGDVVNLGRLNAADGGYVALIGRAVRNDGTVTARLGSVAAAAGDRVTLNFEGNSLVGVAIEQGTLDALVANGGAIRADGGRIVLAAKTASALIDAVVNTTGELRARTIGSRDGRILLLSDMEHGRTEVGGLLDASAPAGGNGGFIETSAAKVRVADDATITTAAAQGRSGTWLIDPTDFVIAATGGDITGAQLSTQLANGSVVIQTQDAGGGNGDILVQDPILKAAGGDARLTLQAHNGVRLAQDVSIASTSGKLDVFLSGNNGGAGSSPAITLEGGSAIRSNGGDIVLGGALASGRPTVDRGVGITLAGATLDAGAGRVDLLGGDVVLEASTSVAGRTVAVDASSVSINWAEAVKVTASDTLQMRATGNIDLSGSYQVPAGATYITADSQSTLSAGRSMVLDAGGDLNLYGLSVKMTGTGTNTMTLSAGGSANASETSFSFAGAADLTLKVLQASNQADIANVDAGYTTVAGWLAGTRRTAYDLLEASSGGSFGSSHFGLRGAGYRLQVYGDGPLLTVTPKALDNGNLAIGTGLQDSVNELGNLRQPFYYDTVLGRWFKLTYSDYDMDLALGTGGTTTAGWNGDGAILSSQQGSLGAAISGLSLDSSRVSGGVGTVLVGYNVTDADGKTLRMSNEYSLGTGDRFIKTITRTTNTSASAVDNVRLWVGTRDDWVAISDSNVKTKGNITANGFEAISDPNTQARSIVISEFDPSTAGTPGSAVLFHSTNVDADTVTDRCCSFRNVYNKDPRTSDPVTAQQDGSYGIFMNYGSMAAGSVRQVTWYYGAAPLSSVGDLVGQVVANGGTRIEAPTAVTPPVGAPAPAPLPAPVAVPAPAPVAVPGSAEAGIAAVRQGLVPPPPPLQALPVLAAAGPATDGLPRVVQAPAGLQAAFGGGDGLLLSPSANGQGPSVAVGLGEARQMLGGQGDQVRVPASRNSLVQIVNGGVTLPGGVEQLLFVTRED